MSAHGDHLACLLAVRPAVLGFTLVILEVAFVSRGAFWPIFVLGALHTWSHSSFVLLPILGAAVFAARLLRGEPLPWRVALATLAGPLAASVFHPYFPNNWFVYQQQLLDVTGATWGLAAQVPLQLFGDELKPASTKFVLDGYPAWAPVVLGILALLTVRPSRPVSTWLLALLFFTGLVGVLACLTKKFLLILFPIALLAAGQLWTELCPPLPLRALWQRHRRGLVIAGGLLVLCLLVPQFRVHIQLVHNRVVEWDQQNRLGGDAHRDAVQYLIDNASPGDLVYHNFFWDFSMLYHFRPNGRYVVALDPIFFYRYDPELFAEALEALRGQSLDFHRVLRDEFGARWLYLRRSPQHLPMFRMINRDPRFQPAYMDGNVVIYRL
jgi:hypothetical protein